MCSNNWFGLDVSPFNVLFLRRRRSQSCPFCRDSLKCVNSGDLWIYTDLSEIVGLSKILRENLQRLFVYIEKLPLIVPDPVFLPYDSRLRWRKICIWGPSLYIFSNYFAYTAVNSASVFPINGQMRVDLWIAVIETILACGNFGRCVWLAVDEVCSIYQ